MNLDISIRYEHSLQSMRRRRTLQIARSSRGSVPDTSLSRELTWMVAEVYASYVDYASGWNRYTMKFMGIWPEERKYNRISSYKVLLPASLMFFFMAAPQTINLYFIWGDFDLIVDNLSVANMTVTIALMKMIVFWFSALKVLLNNMENDRNEVVTDEYMSKMTKISDMTRKISIGSTIISNAVVVLWAISRFLIMRRTGRELFLRSYFPYETLTTPNFELTSVGQIVSSFYTATTYTAVDTFVAMLVFHVCGQLAILRHQLKHLCSSENKYKFRANLKKLVKKHNSIIRFAGTIEEEFNGMLLLQMLGCTIELCVLFFQALLALTKGNQELFVFQMCFLALYIFYILLQIYLYCYIGERLLSESTKMANAAYECEWYKMPAKEVKSLVLIIRRARSPLKITAGQYCSFNLELFSKILKTSMGYLSVLYTMNTKDVK